MRIRMGKKKRAVSLLLIAGMLCALVVPLAPPASAEGLDVPAPAAVLMEFSTGEVLYEKNPHEVRPCASITKVMTLLLVFEAIDSGALHYDDMLTASAHAAGMGGSDIWLKEGEQMTVDDLIKACVVMSANDAAVVLAEAVAGTEEAFVERMNARAAELGMNDTVFKNCNGLDEDGHVTSAYDVAVMSRALMQHEKIFDYTTIWIDYVRGGETQLVNTNKLVRSYNGITGLKTGTTSAAGSCISASAERNGMTDRHRARCGQHERPLCRGDEPARLRLCQLEDRSARSAGAARAACDRRHDGGGPARGGRARRRADAGFGAERAGDRRRAAGERRRAGGGGAGGRNASRAAGWGDRAGDPDHRGGKRRSDHIRLGVSVSSELVFPRRRAGRRGVKSNFL